ncbi:hypothetical protein BJ165DRAFT_1397499 [Panaeolus papilionaceus]|nr:hypothetical protein BJ165DRAFT_1397499 [Panaeolus papilionaceus]
MAVNTSLVFTCKDDLGLSVGNLIDIRQTSAKLELRRTGVTDDMMGLNHFETQRRRREILERVHFAAKGPILCAGNSRRGHSSVGPDAILNRPSKSQTPTVSDIGHRPEPRQCQGTTPVSNNPIHPTALICSTDNLRAVFLGRSPFLTLLQDGNTYGVRSVGRGLRDATLPTEWKQIHPQHPS